MPQRVALRVVATNGKLIITAIGYEFTFHDIQKMRAQLKSFSQIYHVERGGDHTIEVRAISGKLAILAEKIEKSLELYATIPADMHILAIRWANLYHAAIIPRERIDPGELDLLAAEVLGIIRNLPRIMKSRVRNEGRYFIVEIEVTSWQKLDWRSELASSWLNLREIKRYTNKSPESFAQSLRQAFPA